jgi:CO/xanthine dehydrogenase Mo-binding subunit
MTAQNSTATGIGAAVRRKEDLRFITGKGQYTDDISRPGETRAMFVRSPHAHAKIRSVDTKAAAAMPGVLAVLTGAQLATDKIGNLICGWMIHSKGRLADEDGATSRDCRGQGLLCRRSGGSRRRRDDGAGARRRREGQGRL